MYHAAYASDGTSYAQALKAAFPDRLQPGWVDFSGLVLFNENVNVLHKRMKGIANWLIATDEMQSLDLGYFGVGVSAATALAAAAFRPDAIHAIVAVAPRIDLVSPSLSRVVTPTLLMVAERDTQGLDMSRRALVELTSNTTLDFVRETRERGLPHTLEAIPGVANVFENAQSRN